MLRRYSAAAVVNAADAVNSVVRWESGGVLRCESGSERSSLAASRAAIVRIHTRNCTGGRRERIVDVHTKLRVSGAAWKRYVTAHFSDFNTTLNAAPFGSHTAPY